MKNVYSVIPWLILTCVFTLPLLTHAATPTITTWETTTNDETITIPTNGGGYNYTVDWGDGQSDTGLTGDATHSYTTPDIYTVTITGVFPGFYFNNAGDKDKIISIEQWGSRAWTQTTRAFYGARNMVVNDTNAPNLGSATDVSYMFAGAETLDSDFSNWDTSHITNMSSMFKGATNFNGDIESWNVSNVTDMSYMFQSASLFNRDISGWDVSQVTDMSHMFEYASAFNQNISSWDVSNVTDMSYMFAGIRFYNQPLDSWNTSSVTTMSHMFDGVTDFNQNLNSWNVSNVTDMSYMFYGAADFNGELRSWNTRSVTTMSNMFNGAISFNQDIGDWNVSNVTTLESMLFGATAFSQNLGDWDVSNVTTMENMLFGAELSTTDYDALLDGWSQLSLQNNVTFHAGSSRYSRSTYPRSVLTDTFGWTITDGGYVAPATRATTSGTHFGCRDTRATNFSRFVSHKQSLCVYSSTVQASAARTLRISMTGDDVQQLQRYLNTHGFIVSARGVGSIGNESRYFGTKTLSAVRAFQKASGLVADGIVGPRTHAVMK